MKKKSSLFMLAGVVDSLVGILALLVYFGVLPLGTTAPSVLLAVIGAIFLITGIGAIFYSRNLANSN